MNCREHQEFFSDLYDGNLPADRGRELEAHLAGCADCRGEYEAFSASLKALQEAGERAVPEAFVRRVMDTARAESERQVLYQNTGMRRPSTRRFVVPRPRALWAIPALAASALVAFAVGYFIQKQAADRAIDDLKEQLAKSKPVDHGSTPAPEEGVVWEGNQRFTIADFVPRWLEKIGYAKFGDTWISKEMRDRLERGEAWIDGKWVLAKAEIERRVQEEMAKVTGVTDPKAARDRIIEELGLVKRGDGYMAKAMADALDRGLVISPTGEALALDDVVAEKLHELKLVRHEGRWMSEEQRTELLASRRIEKPGGVANTAVTRALDGLEIGPPLGYKNLTLYPLIAASEKSVAVTTFPEAFGNGKVDITDENSLQVRVKNKGDAALVLLAGEILVAGRPDRVVARDTLIPANKDRAVEVFDVEPNQPRGAEKVAFRPESGHYWASLGMRRLLNEEPGQAGVWAAINGPGGKISPFDLYKDHRTGLTEYHMALVDLRSAHALMVGVAVAVGDSLVSTEIFGSPTLLAAHWDRILDSASLEALLAGPGRENRGVSEFPSSVAAVKRMLETAFSAEQDGENDSIVLRRHGRPLGRAVTAAGEAVRLLLFPDPSGAPRPPLDLLVKEGKVKRAVDAYEARLAGATGNRRASILREMAMLPGDYPRQKVLDHAKSDQPRVPAIEALGLRGEPAVVEPLLLEWLKETRKETAVALYAALAQALARLGSEKAIVVLVQDLDPKTPLIARAAADHLPALLVGVRDRNTFEKSMDNLIQGLERFSAEPSDPQGLSWPVRTLRLITGKEYGKITDFQIWWNTPLERQNFLEQRKHP